MGNMRDSQGHGEHEGQSGTWRTSGTWRNIWNSQGHGEHEGQSGTWSNTWGSQTHGVEYYYQGLAIADTDVGICPSIGSSYSKATTAEALTWLSFHQDLFQKTPLIKDFFYKPQIGFSSVLHAQEL